MPLCAADNQKRSGTELQHSNLAKTPKQDLKMALSLTHLRTIFWGLAYSFTSQVAIRVTISYLFFWISRDNSFWSILLELILPILHSKFAMCGKGTYQIYGFFYFPFHKMSNKYFHAWFRFVFLDAENKISTASSLDSDNIWKPRMREVMIKLGRIKLKMAGYCCSRKTSLSRVKSSKCFHYYLTNYKAIKFSWFWLV